MKCPVCGKRFPVLYQTIWTYKRGGNYLCSYDCMRRYDRGEIGMEQKITKEMREEAVRIALKGGNYLKYLRECGSGNPSAHWALIKKKMMKNDPETYEKLAKLTVRKKLVETPEGEFTPATVKIDGPIRIETPEKKKVEVIEIPERGWPNDGQKPGDRLHVIATTMMYKTTGISTPIGDWQYFKKNGYLDWTPLDGNGTVSLNLEEWKELMKLFPEVLKVLGVEL